MSLFSLIPTRQDSKRMNSSFISGYSKTIMSRELGMS